MPGFAQRNARAIRNNAANTPGLPLVETGDTKARTDANAHETMKQHDRPTPRRAEGDRQFVTALARGLYLLRAFRSAEDRLSNQELAQLCSLPKSTVSRLTHTLTKL